MPAPYQSILDYNHISTDTSNEMLTKITTEWRPKDLKIEIFLKGSNKKIKKKSQENVQNMQSNKSEQNKRHSSLAQDAIK